MHWKPDWEEQLVNKAKICHNGVASLYNSMRNLIIITISSIEILETRNSFTNLKNWEISWQNEILGGWGISLSGIVGWNGTHLSTIN